MQLMAAGLRGEPLAPASPPTRTAVLELTRALDPAAVPFPRTEGLPVRARLTKLMPAIHLLLAVCFIEYYMYIYYLCQKVVGQMHIVEWNSSRCGLDSVEQF